MNASTCFISSRWEEANLLDPNDDDYEEQLEARCGHIGQDQDVFCLRFGWLLWQDTLNKISTFAHILVLWYVSRYGTPLVLTPWTVGPICELLLHPLPPNGVVSIKSSCYTKDWTSLEGTQYVFKQFGFEAFVCLGIHMPVAYFWPKSGLFWK